MVATGADGMVKNGGRWEGRGGDGGKDGSKVDSLFAVIVPSPSSLSEAMEQTSHLPHSSTVASFGDPGVMSVADLEWQLGHLCMVHTTNHAALILSTSVMIARAICICALILCMVPLCFCLADFLLLDNVHICSNEDERTHGDEAKYQVQIRELSYGTGKLPQP